jgi:catechol 2,3-dioxygenase-like lactoylglutathione lyase family enzyme
VTDFLTLSHVGLACPDPARTARFYQRVVGLSVHSRDGEGNVGLGLGGGHSVLELTPGDDAAVRVGFEVQEHLLERLAARLPAAEWHAPGGGALRILRLTDPDGNLVELHGPIDRDGEMQGGANRRPDRLHHVTLASNGVEAMADFYVKALGFRVSDELVGDSGVVFVWLRSDREHHSLAIVEAPTCGLDHLAFEISSWEVLGGWCDELARLGVPLTWGPGRHGPGNNLFAFFEDIDGRRIELSCEMERFWDDLAEYARPPRRWRAGTAVVNLWGPLPSWRRAGEDIAPDRQFSDNEVRSCAEPTGSPVGGDS